MKKMYLIFSIFLCVTATNAMEQQSTSLSDDEWTTIPLHDESNVDWPQMRAAISDHINQKSSLFDKITLPLSQAITILQVPQAMFPDIAANNEHKKGKPRFTSVFFGNLCDQNIFFAKAKDVIVIENKKYLEKTISGLSIDRRDTLLLPKLKGLCVALQTFVQEKTIEECEEKQSYTLQGHTDEITGITAKRGLNKFASGSQDKTVRIWNVCTGAVECVFPLEHPVTCVSFHPKKPLLIAVSNYIVYLWNIDTATELFKCSLDMHRCNRAYFDKQKGNQIIAYRADDNASTSFDLVLLNWNKDKISLSSVIYTPLSKSSSYFSKIVDKKYKVTVSNNCLSCEMQTEIPLLCEKAYQNSKYKKKELRALLASQAFKKLPIADNDRFTQCINARLQSLEKQKNKKSRPQQGDVELIELKK